MVCLVQGVGDDGTKIVNTQEVSRLKQENHIITHKEKGLLLLLLLLLLFGKTKCTQ